MSLSSSPTSPAASAMLEENQKRDEPEPAPAPAVTKEKEMAHKTKVIQFLGRTTPIILQNDNGPCPLLAICNVLLLKNNLKLSSDVAEVSQEKLLSLVAELLIDSNSNVNNKDAGYIENQQQNIADAIDLLPRLTTGIDVNIKFRRIDDFEFTRECAIFDLLDIPLYHGWIVDPQDQDTANAIGLNSYNTLMGELVALETEHVESGHAESAEDDVIDFAAATTAALGVPSPSLSRGKSFDDPKPRKGDLEEQGELLKVLKLSEGDINMPASSNDVQDTEQLVFATESEANAAQDSFPHESSVREDRVKSGDFTIDPDSGLELSSGSANVLAEKEHTVPEPSAEVPPSSAEDNKNDCNLSSGRKGGDETETFSSGVDGSEPIYEGEECILESETETYQNREPMYEGEAVLTEQVVVGDNRDGVITPSEGELVRSFLKASASQLTIYGLFCLQEGLKERELCVFFRNNHFNTMFKFEGELYILATDQGYLNQPDLVWEKLNEVNGDTLFVTGNFKQFKLETREDTPWDEQSALASTADYLASIDKPAEGHSGFNSDLQLAIALQQQEFDLQQQQQQAAPQTNRQQLPTVTAASGLITGPQVSRYTGQQVSSSSSSKQEPKSSKEKCVLM